MQIATRIACEDNFARETHMARRPDFVVSPFLYVTEQNWSQTNEQVER